MNDVNAIQNVIIKGITMDSRLIKKGDLFIAVKGLTVDGRDFIEMAIQKGAVAVLLETTDKYDNNKYENICRSKNVPIIPVSNLRSLMGPMAAHFFDDPSKKMPVIGITGTSGKTSVSHFLSQILSYCGKSCAIMGTLGVGFLDQLQKTLATHCTTVDAISTQALLAKLCEEGAKTVAMEVTSHALTQSRVEGITFHTAIFTNLSRDHLDYHGDMESYWQAKESLFLKYKPKFSVINLDDQYGQQLIQNKNLINNSLQIVGYTTKDLSKESNAEFCHFLKNLVSPIALITVEKVVLEATGICANIKTPWGEGYLQCSLLGHFNLSNILAAIAAVCIQGIPLSNVLRGLTQLKTVPGRMMHFGGKKDPLVVVDYSHKPDALIQVLEALRLHCRGKLWCVFGCGGDRDRGKRPLMTLAACRLSDVVIMTQDNPRTENPDQIFADMTSGLENSDAVIIEYDRRKAIFDAVQAANADDIVLIAGKGHEDYQIIGKEEIPFSDQVEVLSALERRKVCAL